MTIILACALSFILGGLAVAVAELYLFRRMWRALLVAGQAAQESQRAAQQAIDAADEAKAAFQSATWPATGMPS